VLSIFDYKEITEDKLYDLFDSMNINLKEIAFIDKNEGLNESLHKHKSWLFISYSILQMTKINIRGILTWQIS